MSDSSHSSHCQRCGAATPDAPEGLCPRCLMAQVMQPTQAGDSSATMPPFKPEEIAPHFPQLEILECLGRGGMGVVYKARQKSLNRLVALKLLAPERADDPHFAARFEKEAQALAALNHPHIVGVHDFGQAGGFYYLLMEFVDGVNLRQLLQTKRLTPKEALSIVPPVCEALQCAHDHGIVHRDIKPENLLIDKSGKVKIADFGVAKMLGATPSKLAPLAFGSQAFGTPDYAAPEQANGQTDHRADIYSLGVVLYEMLTGERPKDKLEAPSKRAQVDIRIDEIVLRALEKTPELRFATATEFRTQVEAVTLEAPPAWSPPEAGWGWLVGKMFGITFRSRRAFQLANLSALGFLAFLGFVPLPGWQRCFGFAGFFGLIGVAFLVELSASKFWPTQAGGAAPPTNPWPRRIFILLALLVAIPVVLFLGVVVPVYQSTRAMARETRQAHEANRRENKTAQDQGGAHQPSMAARMADGFDFPVGAPDGKGYHITQEAFTRAGQKTEHTGDDWEGDGGGDSDLGDPVYAVADGLVMFSKDAKLAHGNVIIVQHTYQEAGGRQAVCESSYHHLLERLVETGARVKRGQKIGTLGSNNGMYPSHLHFELRKTPGMGLEQSPFKKNTENYWQPSQFIREHRPPAKSSGMTTKPVILQYIEATRARDEMLKQHPGLAGAVGGVDPQTNTLSLMSASPQFEHAQRALEEMDHRPDQIFLQCEIREAVKGMPRSADEKVVAHPTIRGLMNQPASICFGSREAAPAQSASGQALKLTLHPVAEPPASRQTTPPRISLAEVITESNSSLPSGEHVTMLETMTVASGGTVEFIHTTLGERTFRFLISARWISGSKTAPALTTTIQGTMSETDLKKLSWHEFDQTPGKYWRELAGVRRFKEAAELIEKMLSLHPELEHLNAANLQQAPQRGKGDDSQSQRCHGAQGAGGRPGVARLEAMKKLVMLAPSRVRKPA